MRIPIQFWLAVGWFTASLLMIIALALAESKPQPPKTKSHESKSAKKLDVPKS